MPVAKKAKVEGSRVETLILFCEKALGDFEEWSSDLIHGLYISNLIVKEERLKKRLVGKALDLLKKVEGKTIISKSFWRTKQGSEIATILRGDMLDTWKDVPDFETSMDAFSVEYQRVGEIAGPLVAYLDSCAVMWRKDKHYSCNVTICNASMTGKSRAVLKVTDWGVFVFSICLRSLKSKGYPPRSTAICDLFILTKDNRCVMRDCVGILIACVKRLVAWLKNQDMLSQSQPGLAEAWLDQQTPNFWLAVAQEARAMTTAAGNMEQQETTYEAQLSRALRPLKEILEQVRQLPCNMTPPGCLKILFSFDEPGALLGLHPDLSSRVTCFDILRRSLRILPHGAGLIAVFTDTSSNVSKLAAPFGKDSSLRANQTGINLFSRFWQLASMDTWPMCKKPLTVGQLEQLEVYSIFGRPGFHAITLSGGALTLLPTLKSKLVCDHEDGVISEEDALAVIGALTSLNVAASSKASASLCQSHMRMCIGISKDRESIYTFQTAEPALSNAAILLLRDLGWATFLQHLKSAIGSTNADAGYRGELTAQFLLLMASDQTRLDIFDDPSSTSIPALPLNSFLSTLIGSIPNTLEASAQHKYIRFTQFVQLFSTPTTEILADLWKRSAAGVCKNCNKGCDLIIPVLCLKPRETLSHVVVEGKRMTVVALQVHCSPRSLTSLDRARLCTEKITRSDCATDLSTKHPFFCGLLEMRGVKSVQVYGAEELAVLGIKQDGHQMSFSITGMRPSDIVNLDPFEESELDSAFDELNIAYNHPLDNPAYSDLPPIAYESAISAMKHNFRFLM